KSIKLTKRTEEYACLYLVNRQKVRNHKRYDENFWNDWQELMQPNERSVIQSIEKCNFTRIENYIQMNKLQETQRKKLKKMRKANEFCMVDGKREKIKNPMVEPPGVFVGEGDHPLNGKIKPRITPEMVTINCSEGIEGKPPRGHTFKEVQHDNTVLYLAFWHDPVLDKRKYIELSASSRQKAQRDKRKYEVARNLHGEVVGVRDLYESDFHAEDVKLLQSSLALYLIDTFCLRPGYQKKTGFSAETKGCCTLSRSNIHLFRKAKTYCLKLEFMGKSSIPFEKEVEISKTVYEKLKKISEEKEDDDKIFDLVKAQSLNKYMKRLCESIEGVTLKTFRTYHASTVFEKELQNIKKDKRSQMVTEFNKALRIVASLCNHTNVNTGKENYIDPRIIVAWCLKWNIPIRKIYKPLQQEKFQWAIKAKDPSFIFAN
ncbi:DNA topoisomerase 1-like, partial [Saccostrea cucullata]|uniref:DNA topoisomerase 1-like n=1 Tax=Saccostrea cuccullata TaxID=36930 RepID=UPI002ECFFBDA